MLGPSNDGGYYMIGINRPHPEVFEAIHWSTDQVLRQTLDLLKGRNVRVTLLPEWTDVDTAADLTRLIDGAAAHAAGESSTFMLPRLVGFRRAMGRAGLRISLATMFPIAAAGKTG